MTNAWNMTKEEYRIAVNMSACAGTDEAEAAWQLCRFYRGEIFYRDMAAAALRTIRAISEAKS
jgi:hypothetical protein